MKPEKYQILFVEDETNIGETLTERLQEDYATVVWAATKKAADAALGQQSFDLALLDIGLPDGSGFDIAEQIRATCPATSVIFLTAMGSPDDRIRGLELGAEDYVVKPFHLRELLLRISNVLKRSARMQGYVPDIISIGVATIDLGRYTATVAGLTQILTHKECLLLRLLHEERGQVVSRDHILDKVWPDGEYPSQRTVDNFMVRIRRLVDKQDAEESIIKSIRAVGYQLEEESG